MRRYILAASILLVLAACGDARDDIQLPSACGEDCEANNATNNQTSPNNNANNNANNTNNVNNNSNNTNNNTDNNAPNNANNCGGGMVDCGQGCVAPMPDSCDGCTPCPPPPIGAERTCEDVDGTPTCAWACQDNLVDANGEANDGCECTPLTEGSDSTCDNIDDDCDGTADEDVEGVGDPCTPNGALGACAVGAMQCDTEGEVVCVGPPPSAESCDGIDSNCDGEDDPTDDDLDLALCPPVAGASATTCTASFTCRYECNPGLVDTNGDLNTALSNGCECETSNGGVEVCDGEDNDCDGLDDASDAEAAASCLPPTNAHTESCTGGQCVFECDRDTVDLDQSLNTPDDPNGCECAITNNGEESCDGLDNDCDGLTDADDHPDATPLRPNAAYYQPPTCSEQRGVCLGSTALACAPATPDACDDNDYFAHDTLYVGLDGLDLSCDSSNSTASGFDENCDGNSAENCCMVGAAMKLLGTPNANRYQLAPTLAAVPGVSTLPGALLAAWEDSADPPGTLTASGHVIKWVTSPWNGADSNEATEMISNRFNVEPALVAFQGDAAGFALVHLGLNATSDDSIRALWYQGSELTLDVERTVLTDGTTDPRDVTAVAWGADRGILVAWVQQGRCPNANLSCVRARRVTPAGGTEALMELDGASTLTALGSPALVSNGSGGLIVWRDRSQLPPKLEMRVLDASGQPQNPPGSLDLTAYEFQYTDTHPTLLMQPTSYLVAYEDYVGSVVQIRVVEVSASDLSVQEEVFVTTGGAKSWPRLVALPNALDGSPQVALLYVEAGNSVRFQKIRTEQDNQPMPLPLITGAAPFAGTASPIAVTPIEDVGVGVAVSWRASGPTVERVELMVLNADGDRMFCP